MPREDKNTPQNRRMTRKNAPPGGKGRLCGEREIIMRNFCASRFFAQKPLVLSAKRGQRCSRLYTSASAVTHRMPAAMDTAYSRVYTPCEAKKSHAPPMA